MCLQNFEKQLLTSSCLSVCLSVRQSPWDKSAPTGWNCVIFVYFSKICQENTSFIKVWQEQRLLYNGDQYIFSIISWSVPLRMRNVSDKGRRENRKKHILCSITFFFRKSCRLWDHVEKYCSAGQATIWRMHISCCIPKNTHTHTLRICNVTALLLQQWLHERASIFR